jgi:ribosomal protein S3
MNKKIKVKVNPLLLDKSSVRDTISGIQFNHNDWVEVDTEVWERLKDAKYKQGTTKVSVLICNDEELDDSIAEDDKESVEEEVEDFFIAEEE